MATNAGLEISEDAKIKMHFRQVWKIKLQGPAKNSKLKSKEEKESTQLQSQLSRPSSGAAEN